MPDFHAPELNNPLMGTTLDTHQENRTSARSRCFERGYHRGPDHEGLCEDCGARGGLGFKSNEEIPRAKVAYDHRPPVIAHNPEANFEELMRERGMTPDEHRAAQKARADIIAGAAGPEIKLTPEEATKVGEAYVEAAGIKFELEQLRAENERLRAMAYAAPGDK